MKTGALAEARITGQAPPVRVLIVEPSSQDAQRIVSELEGSGMRIEPTIIEDHEQFSRAIQNGSFDAILSGYRLPGWNGLEA